MKGTRDIYAYYLLRIQRVLEKEKRENNVIDMCSRWKQRVDIRNSKKVLMRIRDS